MADSPGREIAQNAATDLVVDHVRQLIVSGALSKGQRLPPERDLVQQLGVSRTSVRAGRRGKPRGAKVASGRTRMSGCHSTCLI